MSRSTRFAKIPSLIGGRYAPCRHLGSGGFSEVWEAEDTLTKRRVALKRYLQAADGNVLGARNELTILRMHRLPGMVDIFDEGIHDDHPYLVMELVVGAHFPGTSRRTDWNRIEHTAIALLETLARIHAEGVVHLDLKPANVLVSRRGHPTILDFGVAVDVGVFMGESAHYVEGTIPYMSPERLRGEMHPEPSDDLYSLGILLFRSLTGRLPHEGASTRALLATCRTTPCPPIRSVSPSVPPLVADVIDRLVAHDPSVRPASAYAVLAVLRGQTTPSLRPVMMGFSPTRRRPLGKQELAALFEGPERLFHLKTDAANILFTRTRGLPQLVELEIAGWLRANIADSDGRHLLVRRTDLDRMRAHPFASFHNNDVMTPQDTIPDELREVLEWVSLARPRATAALLARCMDLPRLTVEQRLAGLLRLGAIRRCQKGGFDLDVPQQFEVITTNEWRRYAHSTIAQCLPPEDPERGIHLLLGVREGDTTGLAAIAESVQRAARALAAHGDLRKAFQLLHQAILRLRGNTFARPTSAETAVLETWLDLAFSDGTSPVIALVHYEISRARLRTPYLVQLEALAQAALSFTAGGSRALEEAERIAQFQSVDMERRRQGLRVLSARRCAPAVEMRVMRDVARWVLRHSDDTSRARYCSWRGFYAYRRGSYQRAARLHEEAARLEPFRVGRASARIAQASAELEAFLHADALAHAQEALREAKHCGSPYIEARAEWVLRSAMYRRGMNSAVDRELLEAVRRLASRDMEAMMGLTEAAFAYRGGQRDEAIYLAMSAHESWISVHDTWPALLARSLALAAGDSPRGAEEITDVLRRARGCPTRGLGIQAIALLLEATLRNERDVSVAHTVLLEGSPNDMKAQLAMVPRRHWGKRMDVLSVRECVRIIEAVAPGFLP